MFKFLYIEIKLGILKMYLVSKFYNFYNREIKS